MYTSNDFKERFKPRELLEIQELSFIKQNNMWFCDLQDYRDQGGSFASQQMIAGSDNLLEFLSKGSDKVSLTVSLKPIILNGKTIHDLILIRTEIDVEQEQDKGGASYEVIMNHPLYQDMYMKYNCWLCSVSTFVFGGTHPEMLFIKVKN